ncbi:sigma-54 dependent transcriptional regulator [Stenotrophomonas sp. HITSZ_GD]|uniref:sigma 54-interacting transcriptional regulator n=1 Tax=Stenotrophomonas sp. HITSZ_GD TaxID=3037248 RepID=UPI00240D78D6|nr:sigma-54 dependent transcriptional regulator [Stenotrophomonas sp. HITSZ_GD]MDG2524164.1 sigma-54 dependent transcriptional regulator [Stenotrophomonas sp. HITSZ_GD]
MSPQCEHPAMSSMVGDSAPMRHLKGLLQCYARCNASVLIEGETGTGKELVARELHYASARRDQPFVPVNCGALPDTLLEAELFGHRRGAFTDARSSEQGLVEFARGGTLFLDEVDSLSAHAQTTLLRFLQSGEFRVVGERPVRTADVRVLAATNASLPRAIEQGRFRSDLYYRLGALQLTLPPLRERGHDLPLLALHLLADLRERFALPACEWTPAALQALARHDWPGNVRELENVILRACVRVGGGMIGVDDLVAAAGSVFAAGALAPPAPASVPHEEGVLSFADAKQRAIDRFEQGYLTQLMARSNYNVSRAATLADTERRHLGRMLKRHGIGRPD